MLKFIALTFLIFHDEIVIASQHSSQSQNCGQRNNFGSRRAVPNEADPGEFPWMVSIVTYEYGATQYICSGTLIHPRMVLTSAQCIQSLTVYSVDLHSERSPSELTARFGVWDLQGTDEEKFRQYRNVSKIIYHESVNHPLSNFQFNDIDDFALLILTKRVTINSNVQTICLPNIEFIVDENNCFVSGWAELSSKKLQLFNQTIVNYDDCQTSFRSEYFGSEFNLTRRFICAIKSQDSFCYNFEGSPLVCPLLKYSNRYVQIGTFSWVSNCGLLGIPNLYGDISRIRSWIDQQIENIDNTSRLNSSVKKIKKKERLESQRCGRHYGNADSKITQPNETHFSRLPWMVSVVEKNNGKTFHRCSGSLIHPRIVLTAAHCTDGLKISKIMIKAGNWDIQKFRGFPYQQSQFILNVTVLNKHDDSSNGNAFALLYLSSPFTLTRNITTVCLPDSNTVFDRSHCFVSMWKDNSFNESNQTDCATCLKTYFGHQSERNNDFICTHSDVGRNTSNYEAGSPLVCPTSGKKKYYIQIGSLFRNDICAKNGKMNIFGNIVELRSLIDDRMEEFGFNISSYVHSPKDNIVHTSQKILYIITPANDEFDVKPDLTRLAQKLMILKNIYWIVIENAKVATPEVTNLLGQSGLKFEHLTVQMPDQYKFDPANELGYGIFVNRGLEWIRANATSGVVCFTERGTVYDVELFKEMRATRKISMFPVGYETKSGVSSPIIRKGILDGYYDEWRVNGKYRISMSGFALNIEFFHQRPNAKIPITSENLADGFIRNLEPFETSDIQFLANNCTRILVWNTTGTGDYSTEPLDMKLYEDTNIVELKKQIF